MRRTCPCLVAALCVVPSASSQSMANLSVSGIITPAACSPNFSGGDVYLGQRAIGGLSRTRISDPWLLPRPFSVICDNATRFGLVLRDNRSSSSMSEWGPHWYGLGHNYRGERFGSFAVYFNSAELLVNNSLGAATVSTDDGGTWSSSINKGYVDVLPGLMVGSTTAAGVSTGPEAITSLRVNMWIHVLVAPIDHFDHSDEIAIDGSVTMEVVYL